MDKKLIEVRREYKRKWAREHPESVKRSQERYWQKLLAQRDAGRDTADIERRNAGGME